MVAINLFAILKYTQSFNEEDETMIIQKSDFYCKRIMISMRV